ncbi:MAG: extracellular solute-binding protein [Oscillospiraceae bacterium]|nr:extracellular solute-binding protein [Oscillospiraceae bacterium]
MRKITKRILAGIMSAATLASFAACADDGDGGGGGGAVATTETTTERTEWTGDNIEVTAAEELDTSVDISGKTLKWLGFYDLNPTNSSPERSVEVALFEDTYGAKIEWIETTHDKRFDDLATSIIGGTPPDIFVLEDRTFPYDVSKGQYQAIDSLVDWNDPMWAEMKATADKFTWQGEHYVAPLGYGFNDYQLLMYDEDMVEEEGLDDPYELYEKNEWDWDNFLRLQKEFQDGGDDRYGIVGWWANAFVATSGDTLVTYDGNKFINNLLSPNVERAQGVIKEMVDQNLIDAGDWGDPSQAFVNGNHLFYAMGTWALNQAADKVPDHHIKVVPFPRNPNTDTYYMGKRLLAYMWVKGSENGDVVKAWFDVNRIANSDPQYIELNKQKFLSNDDASHWTEDVYDTVLSFSDDSVIAYSFDYGVGISDVMTGDNGYVRTLYEIMIKDEDPNWTRSREEYYSIFDAELEPFNS